MNAGNKHMFIIALLGSIKLILFSFGITFIPDSHIDAIINGISSICVLSGIILNYISHKKLDGKHKK
jgi:uncharacterized membrane protein